MSFKLWSELNPEVKKSLSPDLGLRKWDLLSKDEKYRIWKYLEEYFFDVNPKYDQYDYFSAFSNGNKSYFDYSGSNVSEKRNRINYAVSGMCYLHKLNNYAPEFLENGTHFNACKDFKSIFFDREGDAVIELLSLYCQKSLEERKGQGAYYVSKENRTKAQFQAEVKLYEQENFKAFAIDVNKVFADFCLNIYLTESGFIPRQEKRIISNIYEPVITCLADAKWKEVNNLLSDAFKKYRENTPQGYSTCVTHTVAAVEAVLQIIVKGKTGEGDFAGLVSEGQRRGIIPSDMFTKEMFRSIIAVLMRERKETGDAHVKQAYATEKNAKMVLNLAMVFIQHCLLN